MNGAGTVPNISRPPFGPPGSGPPGPPGQARPSMPGPVGPPTGFATSSPLPLKPGLPPTSVGPMVNGAGPGPASATAFAHRPPGMGVGVPPRPGGVVVGTAARPGLGPPATVGVNGPPNPVLMPPVLKPGIGGATDSRGVSPGMPPAPPGPVGGPSNPPPGSLSPVKGPLTTHVNGQGASQADSGRGTNVAQGGMVQSASHPNLSGGSSRGPTPTSGLMGPPSASVPGGPAPIPTHSPSLGNLSSLSAGPGPLQPPTGAPMAGQPLFNQRYPSATGPGGTVRPPASSASAAGPPLPSVPMYPGAVPSTPASVSGGGAVRPGGVLMRPQYAQPPAATNGPAAPISSGPGMNRPPMPQMPMSSGGPARPPLGGPPMPSGTNGPPMPPMPGTNGPPMPNANGPPMPPMPGTNGPAGMPPMPGTNGPMPPMPPASSSGYGQQMAGLTSQLGGMSVTNQQGFQRMWGQESLDLLQNRHILPGEEVIPPRPKLQAENWNNINCSSEIFRSTLTKIPETDALLKKSRLPLGILIHPFKDLSHLPVIQCTTIVRCRSCRTYINPFVHFVDQRRWRCNLCYRVNELPEEFLYDPVSKSYGDPSRRPECKSSTIEFIAPQEYMLRPPQPAVYLFLLDVSHQAIESGYLRNFCDVLSDEIDKLPGDSRTQVGFITYSRTLQFYMIPDGASQASQLIVGDVDDVFLPSPSDLLVNLHACREQILQMLTDLPELFNGTQETESCLGAALQAGYKMISPTGGRITVFQCILPTLGPGALSHRELNQSKDPNDSSLLGPSTDFYKKLALDCSGQQVAVDCFIMNNTHLDLATISGISKFSGGQILTFPGYHSLQNPAQNEKFERSLRRYLTRKVGFEAVMRIRCTRGMSLHTFHGHFFVRSTDLLSLPNINPDAGFGMQVSIDEELRDSREVSFQAALLYTSSKGERRIRVHTLCVPTSSSLQDIIQGADQHCIVGLLAKMAVDRSLNASLSDAREAFINVCVDTITKWKAMQCISQSTVLPISYSMRLLPLLILSLLKSPAFSSRPGIKLDDRTSSLIDMKCLPIQTLIQSIYPDLYRVDQLELVNTQEDEEGVLIPDPPRLQLSAEHVALSGAYLMDLGTIYFLYIGKVVSSFFCEKIFGVGKALDIDENITDLPVLSNDDSERLRTFIQFLNSKKSHAVPIKIIRDDSKARYQFTQMLVDDRTEASFSYYEFLQHLKTQIK